MKRLLILTAVAVAVGLGVALAELIDAENWLGLEDDEAEVFAARVGEVLMLAAQEQGMAEPEAEQLGELFRTMILQYHQDSFLVEQLWILKGIWIPVIRDLQERVDALEGG